MRGRTRGSTFARSLSAILALTAAALALTACAAVVREPVRPTGHPDYEAGRACDDSGCHDSFEHKTPYQGPCGDCHNTLSWLAVTYTHEDQQFNTGIHPSLGCPRCHTEGTATPSPDCGRCHKPPHATSKGVRCTSCHTAISWRIMQAGAKNHVSLLGGHADLKCTDCHVGGFGPVRARRTCASCHGAKHGGVVGCERCHDPQYFWEQKPGFAHVRSFPLTKHARVSCIRCHARLDFVGSPASCTTCHRRTHGGTTLSDCATCHNSTAWKPSRFTRATHANFWALTGSHARLACTKCHAGIRFGDIGSSACTNCHRTPHGRGMPACLSCHTTTSFDDVTFSHSRVWPLTGSHRRLACVRCHAGLRFADISGPYCTNCHRSPHGARVMRACLTCHDTVDFSRAPRFEHSRYFGLTGAHRRLACGKCHTGLLFTQVKGRTCAACHGTAHGGYRDCTRCHTTTAFRPTSFRHSSVFTLTGAHTRLACTRCHPNRAYARNRPRTCVGCHGTAHGGLTQCTQCHTTTAWRPSRITRHPSSFLVSGDHMSRPCRDCHTTLVFTGPTKPCRDCHTTPHVGPSDCRRCHWATSWSSLHFTHPSMIYHEGLGFDDRCEYCHPGRDYTRSVCTRCHNTRPQT